MMMTTTILISNNMNKKQIPKREATKFLKILVQKFKHQKESNYFQNQKTKHSKRFFNSIQNSIKKEKLYSTSEIHL